MKDFELPVNIRQIGSVDDRLRIYVEDYAISYMKRFAESGGDSDRLAFLVGKFMVIDGQSYLFICGAVQGKYTVRDDGAEIFSDDSFDHAQACLEKYFEGYEIVGWMQSQPGYGTRLNPVCGDYHMNNFIKPYHSLLVIDPTEKLESFYLWEKNMSEMMEAKGYFIYYDKNRGMQEYILDNRLTGVKTFKGKESEDNHEKHEKREKSGTVVERGTASFAKKTDRTERAERAEVPRGTGARNMSSPEYKKVINMLVSLSAVLFILCFIMGAGLIQSDGKINDLERDLSALNGAFSHVVGQVNQLNQQVLHANAQVQTLINAQTQAQPVYSPADTPIQAAQPAQPTPDPRPMPTPEPQNQQTQQTVQLPQATIPPSQPPVDLSSLNTPMPTPSPNRGLTQQEATVLALEMGNFDTYMVQRGDTLSGISLRYYGTTEMIETIMEVNGITHPDMIFFGRVLLMPRMENAEASASDDVNDE